MTEHTPPHAPQKPRAGHEESDVSGRGLLIFAILFICGLGLSTLFLTWLLREMLSGPPAQPPSGITARVVPDEPRLQGSVVHPGTPRADLAQLQRQHQELLNSYGWIDQKSGVARVPVERAMSVYLEAGTPPAGMHAATRPGPDSETSSAATSPNRSAGARP